MSLGPFEIILIILVIALLFGAKKLPELMKGMGQGIREFKQEVKDPAAPTPPAAPLPPQTAPVVDVPSQPLDTVVVEAKAGGVTETVVTGERR